MKSSTTFSNLKGFFDFYIDGATHLNSKKLFAGIEEEEKEEGGKKIINKH